MTSISLLNLTLNNSTIGISWSGDLIANGVPIATVASSLDGVLEILEYIDGAVENDLFALDDAIVASGSRQRMCDGSTRPTTLSDLCGMVVASEILRRDLHRDAEVIVFEVANAPKTAVVDGKIDVTLFDSDDPAFIARSIDA